MDGARGQTQKKVSKSRCNPNPNLASDPGPAGPRGPLQGREYVMVGRDVMVWWNTPWTSRNQKLPKLAHAPLAIVIIVRQSERFFGVMAEVALFLQQRYDLLTGEVKTREL